LGAPGGDVGAENVAAFTPAGPVLPLGADRPGQAHASGDARVRGQRDGVAPGSAGVAGEQPAQLPLQGPPLLGSAGVRQSPGEPRSMTQMRWAAPYRRSMVSTISRTVVTSVRLPGNSS